MRTLTSEDWESFYSKCWDLLVEHAGANGRLATNRADFTKIMMDEHDGSSLWACQEYRFGGVFGMGGKFRRNNCNNHWVYIDYYPEDRTVKLDASQKKVNDLLRALQEAEVNGPIYGPPKQHEVHLARLQTYKQP